jgi:hypothetical protein
LQDCLPLDPLRLLGIRISQLIDKDEFKKNSLERFFKKSIKKEVVAVAV